MDATGHWHVTRSRTLSFAVTDATGNPISGLNLTVTIKTPAGSVNTLRVAAGQVVDNGDGDYSADYTASDLGLGYPPPFFSHTTHL